MAVMPQRGSGRLQAPAFSSYGEKIQRSFSQNYSSDSRITAGEEGLPMSELPKRMLGRTGLQVTTPGYRAMELRGAPRGPAVSDEAVEKVLNAVLDAGINFIDTSIDYGRSEELIGRFLAHRRSEYFLASKCGCVPGMPGGSAHLKYSDRRGARITWI